MKTFRGFQEINCVVKNNNHYFHFSMSKTNRFCFTLNNYEELHYALFSNGAIDGIKYFIVGKEVGEQGTPHLQGYVEFPNNDKLRISAAKSRLERIGLPNTIHIEPAKGTAQQNITYCSKDGTFVEGGERPKGQGKRTDLDDVCDKINSGSSLNEIANEFPVSFIKYSTGIQKLMNLKNSRRFFKTEVIWLYGSTGTGKSRFAWTAAPEAYMKCSSHKWWDGYTGQDVVIVDDYRPSAHLPFHFMLNLMDRYPLSVEVKGATVEFISKKIYITSPYSPQEVCENLEWVKEEMKDQFLRRIDEVRHFSAENPWNPPQI